MQVKSTLLINRLGFPSEGGVEAGAWGGGSLILILPNGFPASFLIFFKGVGLADALLACLSL
jgi:hypothetical protein